MIDTPKFAFILAPYEIAVPTTTCCSNKTKRLLTVVLALIHVARCVLRGVKRGRLRTKAGMDLSRVFHLLYPFPFTLETQGIKRATNKQFPPSVSLQFTPRSTRKSGIDGIQTIKRRVF